MIDPTISSICILRLSAIGDVCNAIAAVQCIQNTYPNAKITWVTGKVEAELLTMVPNIQVEEFDKKAGFKGYLKLWKKLRHVHFDVLLHMQYALRASVATLGIKAKRKIGFDEHRSQDLQHLFINERIKRSDKTHVLDGMMGFAQAIGVKEKAPTWCLKIPEPDKHWARIQSSQSSQSSQSKPHLVIAPSTSKTYKNWTLTGYQDLIGHALRQGWQITLIGSPDQKEVALAQGIRDHFPQADLNDLVGKTTISQMVAIIEQSDLVIAPDSGPAHIANAIGIPIIGLYAHHNPERTGPYGHLDNVISVYEDAILAETGQPSKDLPWRTRVKDEKAMERITSEMVIQKFDQVVKQLLLDKKESS